MKQILLLLLLTPNLLWARGVYQKPADFVSEAFTGQPPVAQIYTLSETDQSVLADILAHPYEGSRLRYWQDETQTVWILNEVGKTKPITAGFVIRNGKIQYMKVLVFRESRGWEVRHDFFSKRFDGITLDQENKLSKRIDNISGATLSVRAVRKMARIALYLNQQVTDNLAPDEEAPTTP